MKMKLLKHKPESYTGLYLCDPWKNKQCEKTRCMYNPWTTAPECFATANKGLSLTGCKIEGLDEYDAHKQFFVEIRKTELVALSWPGIIKTNKRNE